MKLAGAADLARHKTAPHQIAPSLADRAHRRGQAGVAQTRQGPDKPYIFIHFGSARGNTVKISMWSEALAKMKERPSTGWIGRWISVTGLMDVAYQSKRYGLKHLSITVHEDGQIQQIDEAEAGFRLASIVAR
jgi:hypothetical protein